jgi:hypothetical protein
LKLSERVENESRNIGHTVEMVWFNSFGNCFFTME